MITASGLKVKYPDGTMALAGLDFHVHKGENVALVGANGAGKSTLLSTMVGLLFPAEGSLVIDGVTVEKSNLKPLRQKVGLVFQNPDDQLFMAGVLEDIAFGLRGEGCPEEEVRERTDQIIQDLGLQELKHKNTHRLSGGEKRLAAIAGILVMRPSVLLLDEPSSSLDPGARRRMITALQSLPVTKLIATHDLALAMELCSRVIVLKKGVVYAEGEPEEVLSDEALMQGCGLEVPFCCVHKKMHLMGQTHEHLHL